MTTITPQILRRRNAAFAKLTPAKKRVAIIRDALAQIKAEKYRVKTDQYVVLEYNSRKLVESQEDAQCALLQEGVTCQVCARGALLLSTVRKSNDLKTSTLLDDSSSNTVNFYRSVVKNYEENLWEPDQLAMIETAFEMSRTGRGRDLYNDYLVDRCITFGQRYATDRSRLVAILKNMLKNDGQFTP